MKNKKLLSTLLSVAMAMPAAFPCATSAEGETGITVTPVNSAENVSVIDDVTITGISDISGITVEGTDVSYEVIKTADGAKVIFADELAYGEEVIVKNNTEVLTTFTTEQNPITTLYWQDFEDVTLASTNLGVAENSTLKVAGTTVKITAPECSCSDTANHIASCSVGYPWNLQVQDGYLAMKNQGTGTGNQKSYSPNILKMIIDGSENWTDCKISADIWFPGTMGQVLFGVRDTEGTDKHGIVLDSAVGGSGSNDGDLLLYKVNSTLWKNVQIWPSENILQSTWTNVSAEMVGNTITYWKGSEDSATKHSWTSADVAEKGGVWYAPGWHQSRIDNILVEDKALTFTPSALKNITNQMELTFNKAITTDGLGKISVSDGENVIDAPMTLSADGTVVTIDTSSLAGLTEYTLKTSADLTAADGTTANNEKVINFKTGSSFKVTGCSIENGAEDVSVIEDVELTFDSDVDASTLAGIKVTGNNVPYYEVKADGNKVNIVFEEALPYNEAITVTAAATVANEDGVVLGNSKAYTFTTERNPITTLYWQDFEDVTLASTNLGVAENSTLKLGGATAKITAPACSCSDTANHVASCSVGYPWNLQVQDGYLAMKNQGTGTGNQKSYSPNILKMIIDGSENWTDCKISADIWFPGTMGQVLFGFRDTDATDKHGVVLIGAVGGSGTNDGDLLLYKVNSTLWKNVQIWPSENILQSTWTNVSAEMVGNTITYWKGSENSTTKHSWTSAEVAEKGGVWYAPGWHQSRIDNILVEDKGLIFTPEQSKYTDGEVTLTFNEALTNEESTLADLITVTNQNGEEKETTAIYGADSKTVTVDIKDAIHGDIYTITVDNAVASEDHADGMNTSKSFKLVCNLPYSVNSLEITDTDGTFKASATVDVIDATVEDEFTLIIVVYDSYGNMVEFKKDYEKVTSNGEIELSTEGIAKGDGYTASAFIWNNIDEMKALSGKVIK